MTPAEALKVETESFGFQPVLFPEVVASFPGQKVWRMYKAPPAWESVAGVTTCPFNIRDKLPRRTPLPVHPPKPPAQQERAW